MRRRYATKLLQTLGDPYRLSIVEHLSASPHSVQQLANKLPISRPAVSRHLRVLKVNNFVRDEARGAQRIYHLRPDGLAALRAYLEQLWDDAQRRFVIAAENVAPRRNKR